MKVPKVYFTIDGRRHNALRTVFADRNTGHVMEIARFSPAKQIFVLCDFTTKKQITLTRDECQARLRLATKEEAAPAIAEANALGEAFKKFERAVQLRAAGEDRTSIKNMEAGP